MSMWNGKTDLWGRKTRPSVMKETLREHAETEKEDDYMEDQDKIRHLEAQIVGLEIRLKEKCQEVASLNKRLDDNKQFMQTVVLELIQMKNHRPPTSEAKPASALEKYIADKNAKTSSTAMAKLP
jgi:predicted nuclease with TOPRIM domain